ncbi:crosslink repair DNA glycosylase YcaQ family protein [Nocardioides sp. TF02-7]|uniref:DNA glycosylase AlkZ-like family protein n=1 Tax=Nocardioides sp. TF02-7 TaxID=2917724 RepID=UPI001F05F56C|nr:crosslink repair DNA glycosylase YcaQ family protein [Nocardioides sp. TF02-7]UMG93238.1 winged helix DNA-binding domain-containing protein [Nocardioides sp. TF02-7]
MSVRVLDRREARRIAVRAQLLDARRPPALVPMVDDLTLLQIDPTAAIAPNVDLVSWSRLGDAYAPSDLRFALEEERSLVEHGSYVRPMDDVGLVLATVRDWGRHERAREWLAANAGFRADVLARLADSGPLTAADVPDTAAVPWQSTGWTNDKNVVLMLEFLMMVGEVAVAGRQGRLRRWDLAERVYPADLEVPAYDVARAELARRRLASLGVARTRAAAQFAEPVDVGEIGVEVEVAGLAGRWRVDPDAVAAAEEPFEGRTALLSPFDRLVYDRDRALELFDFEYVLEMYKPAAKRRWGYFALPVLHGDRLVGKLDAKADRKAGVLRVHAVHEDHPWEPEVGDGVEAEVQALADWLGLDVVRG